MRILLLWALLLPLSLPASGGDIREFTASPATLCLGEPLDLSLLIEGATPQETPRVDFLRDGAPAGSLELLPVSGAAGLQAQWRPPGAGGYTARPRLGDRPGPSSEFSVVVCLPREGGSREGFLFSTGNPRVLRQPLLREALRGEAFLMGLSLENTGDTPLPLEPGFPGLPAGWVAAEPPRLTLEQGTRGNFSLLASIPPGAEPGDYPAAILLGTARAPFLLRVRAGETNTSRPILTRSVDLEEVPPDLPRVVLLPRARVTLRFWNGAQPSSRAELVEQVPPALAARPAAIQFPDAAPERLPGEPPLLRWVLQEMEPREVRSLSYLVEAQPQEATPYLEWPIRQANVFTESNQTGPGLAIRQIVAPDFTAGRPGTIEANLTQQGETPLPVEVRVEAPGGWTISPPTQNATLPPRGHLVLEFQATPPLLAAGSDVATLRVLYTGGQVERKFTLFAGPDPVPLGAALGAVGLLGAVLYLRQRLRQSRKKDTLDLLREMRRRIR